MPSLYLTQGKGEFVRRQLASGEIQDVCRCKWNADFAKACIAQVHGAYLAEVIRNNGKYDEGSMPQKRREHGINHRCDYCYSYTNWGQVTPRKVDLSTMADFADKKPEIVRIGKNVECGHPFYIPTLVDFLEVCEVFNTKIIFPTKMLPYGQEGTDYLAKFRFEDLPEGRDLARMLKKVGGVVHYSIGADCLEAGSVSQGFTNEWRVEQANRYRRAGVNVDLTLVCAVTQSLEENKKAGFYTAEALAAARKYRIPARILPIRLKSNKLAIKVTECSRSELTESNPALPGHENPKHGTWRRRPNNELVPMILHPDFKALYESGIGICGEVGEEEYCDDCNLCPECTRRIEFKVSEKPEIDYSRKVDAKARKSWLQKEKIKAAKERDKPQLKLDLK